MKLTPREYDILALLTRHRGRIITHRQLLMTVWGPAHFEDTYYLRMAVGHIRDSWATTPPTRASS